MERGNKNNARTRELEDRGKKGWEMIYRESKFKVDGRELVKVTGQTQGMPER